VPYDWAKFLHERVAAINPHADLSGIEQGGYKLVYRDKPTSSERTLEHRSGARGGLDCWYSIGLRIATDGHVNDVRWNGPADKSRIAPGDKVLAVNGEIFSNDILRKSIQHAKGSAEPIHLIVQADNFVRTAEIDYHDGERYPALQRVDGTANYLEEIIKPRTTPEKAPETATPDSDNEEAR
jgi:predicted metalloprotease with PDZ domain